MKKRCGSVLALMLLAGLGCGSNNSGGGGGGGNTVPPVGSRDIVTLAVGDYDSDFENVFNGDQVLVYCDVLNDVLQNDQDPDTILDDTTSLIDHPRHMLLNNGDLYVTQKNDGGNILIFRDVCNLADDSAPDVNLDTLATVDTARNLVVDPNDVLIVADSGDDEVYLWDGASALTVDVAPDAILNNATSLITSPEDVFSDGDSLWVTNRDGTDNSPCVLRFDGVAGIVTGGVAVAPDAALNEDTSFLNGQLECMRVLVDSNTDMLYVTVNEEGNEGNSGVFVFENASTFSDDALPVGYIIATGALMDTPMSMLVKNNRLYVAARNAGDCDENHNFPGVLGIDLGIDGSFQTQQTPEVQMTSSVSRLGATQEIGASGAWFFAHAMVPGECASGFGEIDIFFAGNGGPYSQDEPVITLPPLKDFASPISIAIEQIDAGT